MTLRGKGYFIWQLPNCEKGDAQAIAARAVAAGLSHVLIKIADGASWSYNYDYRLDIDLVPPVVRALRQAGIEVWGWHYVRGDDPLGEARLAIDRSLQLGVDGYLIDAEIEYERKGKALAARRFMEELKAAMPGMPIALSSYRYPKSHPVFPFAEFLANCDLAMPQVYFERAHNPEEQLERSAAQYAELMPARPIFPTAPTYSAGSWRPTAGEITRFMQKAKDLGLEGINAWSWDFAARSGYLDLWNAVADFPWPTSPPEPEMPQKVIEALNEHRPAGMTSLYLENAAHVTGTRTVVGVAAIKQWYKVLFSQLLPNATFSLTGMTGSGQSRQFTWQASSDAGSVLDGNDTISLRDGKIQYHYTYFSVTA
jgi:hypothetical protein